MKSKHYDFLVSKGKPVGEVIAVNRYLVSVRGLQPVRLHALVIFEDGSKGIVQKIHEDFTEVLHLGATTLKVGTPASIQHDELVCRVGDAFKGRVITVTGDPIDGKGPVAASTVWSVFNTAPPIHERKLLDTQLETGVTVIDSLFPLVLGQRLAILGDSKSGKSTIAAQIAINQKTTDRLVIYVLIAKRRVDIDELVGNLVKNDSLKNSIVIVSTMFESLAVSYLAPYVGAAMAEYFWQEGNQDVVIIYDDLTNHAMAYREISLLASTNPGRDSYPGDIFYRHSSLLERAGRISKNGKTLTSLPLVTAFNSDITAFLPTNIMSMTDGQWILDLETARSGIKPAVNTGLSVTRVGGVGHSKRQKAISASVMKTMAAFRQALEYSRFGSELSVESQLMLKRGKYINQIMTQAPGEFFSLMSQQLMLEIVLDLEIDDSIDVTELKKHVNEQAKKVDKDEGNFNTIKKHLISLAKVNPAKEPKDAEEVDAAAEQLARDQAEAENILKRGS